MKLEKNDLEKINEILADVQCATELPFFFFAVKKEATPQYEIKYVYPDKFRGLKDLFLFSVNPLVAKVYQTQQPELTEKPESALKNLMDRAELDDAIKEFHAKTAMIIPLVVERDVVGFFVFLGMVPGERIFKVVQSYVNQLRYYFGSRALQRLARDANSRTRMFLETSPFAFFTIDTQGNHVYVSPGIEQLTGYTQDEFLRGLVKPETYIHEDDLDKFMKFYGQALQGEKSEIEFRLKRKDGNIISVALNSKPMFDADGNLVGVQAVERDVTERKKAEMELSQNIEKEQIKTEFMSLISHELRTPVTPIQGYTEILLSEKAGKLGDEQRSALQIIKSNAKRLLDLIDSVLDITRVEYGKSIEVKKEPVSLNAIVEEVIDSYKFQFDQKSIKLNVALSNEIETILADEAKISRVIANLLGNAIKFTPKKSSVTLKTSKEGETLEFEIIDKGIGLENENLVKVFEKFHQVDSSYTREAGGIGMGLTLVKEIVEAHGGKVWAESEGLGKGSKFIFTIPLS